MPQSHQLMTQSLWTRPANTRTATTRPSAASRSILWSRQRCSQNNCSLVDIFSLSLSLLIYWIYCQTSWDYVPCMCRNWIVMCFLFVCLVVGAFHSQDPSGGHQQPSQQGPGFSRQTQSFYNSRGMSRGGPRNARGMINGYRGSSNGFRGKITTYSHNLKSFNFMPFSDMDCAAVLAVLLIIAFVMLWLYSDRTSYRKIHSACAKFSCDTTELESTW